MALFWALFLGDAVSNIRDKQKYIDAIMDFEPFNDCFAGKVRISDVDGIVEVRDSFMLIEHKSYKTSWDIPMGQHIMLNNFAKRDGNTVCLLFGDMDGKINVEIRRLGKFRRFSCGIEALKRMFSEWDKCARRRNFETFDAKLFGGSK